MIAVRCLIKVIGHYPDVFHFLRADLKVKLVMQTFFSRALSSALTYATFMTALLGDFMSFDPGKVMVATFP
jgi:hypothetical protein